MSLLMVNLAWLGVKHFVLKIEYASNAFAQNETEFYCILPHGIPNDTNPPHGIPNEKTHMEYHVVVAAWGQLRREVSEHLLASLLLALPSGCARGTAPRFVVSRQRWLPLKIRWLHGHLAKMNVVDTDT